LPSAELALDHVARAAQLGVVAGLRVGLSRVVAVPGGASSPAARRALREGEGCRGSWRCRRRELASLAAPGGALCVSSPL